MNASPNSPRGFVVVTGASTGIGAACAQQLQAAGFQVFAGVRREEDAQRLRAEGGGMAPLMLEVTREESIAAARSEVEGRCGSRGLQGLVNNAGIVVAGPLEFLPGHVLREQLEVNVIGVAACTRVFLPLIRRGAGRVVNIGSISGRIAYPLEGAYSASKFALEGMSDSLRRELRGWGIPVSLVNPGPVDTPIWDKSLETAQKLAREEYPPESEELYGPLVEAMLREFHKSKAAAVPAARVADRVLHALTAARPKTRYWVGRGTRATALLSRVCPDRWLDALMARVLKPSRPD